MGLGPPVCVDCGVIGALSEGKGWRCPNCGDDRLNTHLWLLKKEEQNTFELTTIILQENEGPSVPE